MGVPCASCGRLYDIALFPFGRTISCSCGARVGTTERVETVRSSATEPRFAADAMLGRLARWLRLLGYDTHWECDIADADLVRLAISEGRAILTRDRALPQEWRVAGVFLLASDSPTEQLRQVMRAFDLEWRERLFTRCSLCNVPLATASRDAVAGRVPARVLSAHDTFGECPHCGKIYWHGTHTASIRERLARLEAD